MKKFYIVGILCVVILIFLVYLGIERRGSYQADDVGLTFPELREKIANAKRIMIGDGNATINLLVGENGWTLQESDDYPIEIEKLRALVNTVVESKRIEPRSANVDTYEDYGLASNSSRFTVFDANDNKLADVVIGTRMSQLDGWYALIDDDPQVWVISGNISLQAQPQNWLVRKVIDIDNQQLASVRLSDDTIINQTADNQFQVVGEGQNEQIDSQKLDDIFSSLAGLQLLDARSGEPDVSTDRADVKRRLSFVTNYGLVVDVTLLQDIDDQYWASFDASSDISLVRKPDTTDDSPESIFTQAKDEQQDIHNRLGNWWLRIPTSSGKSMAFTRGDLFQTQSVAP